MTDGAQLQRSDTLSFIGAVDQHHTLRILANGSLALLVDPKNRKGRHARITVIGEAEPTRIRAVELALRVLKDARRLTPGFLRAVRARLGDTPVQSLDIAAAHYAVA